MKVSVILPIYNGEKTLATTLASLVSQTFSDFELVACIDGTYDGSRAILEDYSAHFKEVRILQNKENRGLGRTMNRLVSNAKGEYIAVAEQDDYYYPDRLEKQVELLDERHDVGLVSGIAEFWDGDKITLKFPGILVHNKQYPTGIDMFRYLYVNQTKVVNSCMMFRKNVHVTNGLYFSQHYPNIPVDWAYFLRFSLVANIHGLSEILVRIDRRKERDSVTSGRKIRFKANRELLRSFKFEYPEYIGQVMYRRALKHQLNLELRSYYGLEFIKVALVSLMKNPLNEIPIQIGLERIKKKFS